MREQMTYEILRIFSDYLDKFRAGVEKVTQADVARVAARYLHKDQLAVLVVGTPRSSTSHCRHWARSPNVDITIPPPPGAPEGPAKSAQ